MMTRMLAALAMLTAAQGASASIFLVGAQLYSSTATGANSPVFPPYQFSTNITTGHYLFPLQPGGAAAIALSLSEGPNVFTFSTVGMGAEPLGPFAGLNLFFADSATSYDPPHSGNGIAGDLSVFAPSDGSGSFEVVVAGTSVQSYETDGIFVSEAGANGLDSWSVDGQTVFVSSFVVSTLPGPGNYLEGSFTLNVVPAPDTLPLAALALAVSTRRRRQGR